MRIWEHAPRPSAIHGSRARFRRAGGGVIHAGWREAGVLSAVQEGFIRFRKTEGSL
jgi:hypothetical protein